MKKIIFLDRDGVINIDKEYVYKIKDFEFEESAIEGLKFLQDKGYEFIIITNQSGIAQGYYTEEDFWNFNNHVVSELGKQGVKILKTYFSPYHPKKGIGEYKRETGCRKPGTGMLEKAFENFEIDKKNSWVIGDKWADVKCGVNFGINSILVKTGKGGKFDTHHKTDVEYIADDLLDAAKFIIKRNQT